MEIDMIKSAKGLLLLTTFVLLMGCECSRESSTEDNGGVSVVNDESLRDAAANFIATAGDRVFFAFDKSSISPEAEATLTRQADWLRERPSKKVLIEGHCDPKGTREYNLGLGDRRADSAARFLINHGVSGDRVRTISYGKDRPIAVQGGEEDVHRTNRVAIAVIE
jgi:peptidoglycan-associated lipoprotein